MIMEKLDSSCNHFNLLTANPLLFLSGNHKSSDEFAQMCSSLYMFIKSHNKSISLDPIAELYVNGFDDEQIWQQIDMFNSDSITVCSKGAALCLNNKVELYHANDDDRKSLSPCNDVVDDCSDGYDDNNGENEIQEQGIIKEKFETTEVDDEFFSLRQMEKFLEMQESEKQHFNNEEAIDYFAEVPTDDEGDNDDSVEENFANDELFDDVSVTDDDDVHSMSDDSDGNSGYPKDKTQSARDVKYIEFFPSKNIDNKSKPGVTPKQEPMTNYEKQQLVMTKRIKTLEEQALGEKEWQMKGETVATNRPVNSLLQEVLTFDHSQRPAPEITDVHTFDMEKLICQRIKDKSWNDVEKKIKEIKDPHEFKKNIILDSDKSKLSLQEIYEKEYVAKLSQEKLADKEDPAHIALASLMKDLFKKLDALSNFHFCLPPPEPEIKVLTNLPSIAMEEVQPVTHTDADQLAPEEVYEERELKGDVERTATDKKRERRKKAAKQKTRAKARQLKLENLADTNDKLRTLKAVKQLQQAAKHASGQTTIVQNSGSKKRRQMSSKTFFGKLESSEPRKKKIK